jgi:hypothetical protein
LEDDQIATEVTQATAFHHALLGPKRERQRTADGGRQDSEVILVVEDAEID